MALAFERDWLKLLNQPEGEDYLPDSATLINERDEELKTDNSTAWQTPKKMEKPSSSPLSQSVEQYKTVMSQRPVEPKPKWWQRLAAGAAGAGAGYVNTAGRVRHPLDVSGLVQEIKAPGYKRRLSDWAAQVETAEAGVKGEQMKQAASMQDVAAQTARENAASLKAQRDAMAEDRRAATAARDRAAITAPGVEEIKTPPPLETTVPSTVPGLPGQKISVAKPQKQYKAEFEVGGKKYGQRSSEEMAMEQQQIAQANWPTITQKMATDLQQPELVGRKVPPNEFNEFVKMTQGSAGKPLHVVKEGNEITGDVTVTGFDPMTMEQKAQVVLKGIAKKRPPQGPQPPASAQPGPGGSMSPEAFRRVQALGNALKTEPNVKIYSEVRNAFDGMKDASTLGSAGDITIMRLFAKLTDPSTGVREEEYRAMLQAMGLLEKFNLFVSGKWLAGEKLTPAQRANFIQVASKIHDSRARLIRPTIERYRKRATAGGVDPELVFSEADIPSMSGKVKMLAPNGQMQEVNEAEVEFYKSKGAKVVGQ